MELKIIEDKKDLLRFELKGESHTLCNMLKQELTKDKEVQYATYSIAHPLIGIPDFIIKTKSITPREALKKAIKGLKTTNKNFVEAFSKLK